jgi:hypothetical protein
MYYSNFKDLLKKSIRLPFITAMLSSIVVSIVSGLVFI